MNRKKRLLALYILLLSMIGGCKFNEEYVPKYKIVYDEENHCYKYRNGRVFIGDEKFLDSITDISDNDVLVLDARTDEDPDMKIIDSNRVVNVENMEEILEILIDYENNDPSDWDRSITSMRNEWIYHNFSYIFHYKRDSSKDVDLNNDDEKVYRKVITK